MEIKSISIDQKRSLSKQMLDVGGSKSTSVFFLQFPSFNQPASSLIGLEFRNFVSQFIYFLKLRDWRLKFIASLSNKILELVLSFDHNNCPNKKCLARMCLVSFFMNLDKYYFGVIYIFSIFSNTQNSNSIALTKLSLLLIID